MSARYTVHLKLAENGTCFSFTSIVMKLYTKTLNESMGEGVNNVEITYAQSLFCIYEIRYV